MTAVMAATSQNITEKDLKKLSHAKDVAREYIEIAIDALKNLKTEIDGELSPHSIKVSNLLKKHFGNENRYVIGSVLKTALRIERVLNNNGKKYKYSPANIGNKMGRAMFLCTTIKIGAPFFETNLRNRVVTIIHETGHIIGLNFLIPELYEGKSKNMPTIYRLYNADDVALFVYDIAQSKEFKQV